MGALTLAAIVALLAAAVASAQEYRATLSGTITDSSGGALRIKSNSTCGGVVDDVAYADVCIRATKNPIVLDTTYSSPDSSGEGTKIPVYTNIAYRNVRIEGPGNLQLEGHDPGHRLRISFADVHATSDVKTRSKEVDVTGAIAMDGSLSGCSWPAYRR
jgi:polygalacturonase